MTFYQPWHLWIRCLLLAAALLLVSQNVPAAAQNSECVRLRAQIAAMSRGNPQKSASFGRAAQKQRSELARTENYANSIGCNNRQFLFIGAPPPPQCGVLENQMRRMQANLAQLQSQADAAQGGGSSALNDLTYRYNNLCRAPQENAALAATRPRNFFEQLFGGDQRRPQLYEQVPLEGPLPGDMQSSGDLLADTPQMGGSKAVCVRTCDGGFFPVSYSAHNQNADNLEEICRAQCPNAEVRLYSYRNSGEIKDAVSSDGEAYTSLANAFKFQKSYDATCSCKAPGQSWAQALAGAEQVLGRAGRSDILVTQQKADELARPRAPQPKSASPRKLTAQDVTGLAPDGTNAAVVPEKAPGEVAPPPDFEEVIGPDGVKRRVRIVGPKH